MSQSYKMIAGGKNITDRTAGIAWSENEDSIGVQLTFESLADLALSTVVALYIDGKKVFVGVLIEKSPSGFSTAYTATDFAFFLTNEVKKQFTAMPAGEAIKSLLGEFGIKCNCATIPTLITGLFIDKTIAEVIGELLEIASAEQGKRYETELRGDTVTIFVKAEEKIYPEIVVEKDPSVTHSIADLYNKIIVISGAETNTAVVAAVQDDKMIAKCNYTRQEILKVEDADVSRAKNIAANTLKEKSRERHKASLNLLVESGGASLRAGRSVYISAPKIAGWREIKSVSHTIDQGIHKASIEVEW